MHGDSHVSFPRRAAGLLLAGLALGGCAPAASPRIEHYRAGAGEADALHIFAAGHEPSRPAILFFHGGAWQRGSPSQFFPQCRVLARLGYVCISAGYRVAERDGTRPEAAVDDARAAWHYLRAHAARLGIDSRRIALGGGSAGGHLAALLATGQPGCAAPVDAAALILFNPMLDLSPGRPDHGYVAHDWRNLSPLHQLSTALPPALILLGDSDPELSEASAAAFCARARALGTDCRLDVAPGQGHGFFNPEISRWHFARTLFAVHRFMQTHSRAP